MAGICEAFYGEPTKGVYSPSVQYTLSEMGKAVLARRAPGQVSPCILPQPKPSRRACHIAHAEVILGFCVCFCPLVDELLQRQATVLPTCQQQRLQYHETRMLAIFGRSLMADADRVPAIDSIFFNLPNIHFIPCPVVTSKVCGKFRLLLS